MKSAPLQAAAVILLGWATGYLASGPSLAPLPEGPPPPRHSLRSAPVAAGTFAPPAYPPLASHDLAALMRIDWRRLWLNEVEIRLSRMDKATMERPVAEADADRRFSYAKTNLCSRIIREIYQRDKVGAVAWAAVQSFHPELFGKFIQYLAHDDVATAIAWMSVLDDKAAEKGGSSSRGRARARSGLAAPRSRASLPTSRPSSTGRPIPSPFQNGTAPGTPGAEETSTRSRVISSMRQVEAPSMNVCPVLAS